MRDDIADVVHPVISYGLHLKERLLRGVDLDLANEQATLKGLLLTELEAKRWVDFGGELSSTSTLFTSQRGQDPGRRVAETFLGIRYALVCWLDEIFIIDSPWAREWNERKLETSLYGTNERAGMFWEQARRAEGRPGNDALEVFFLCVMLGFRGELREDPQKLQAWVSSTQARIAKGQGQDLPLPPELDPPTFVPPRHGRERLQRMVLVAAIFVLVAIPVLAFFVMNRLFSK